MAETYIIGAGGHSRSVIALVKNLDQRVDGIYDNSFNPEKREMILSVPVIGTLEDIPGDSNLILAIGDNSTRANYFQEYSKSVIKESFVSTTAKIEDEVIIGSSNLVFHNTYINACSQIGDNNILNSGAIIEHEVQIGSHCHISVGTIVAGRCIIGDHCFIGAGAIVKDGIAICDHVTIGAGGVVVKNIESPGIYVGNPVKKLIK